MSDPTERVYMPRQTIALAIALLAAGATAGSGYAYQAAQTRESLAELRTQFQNDTRDLKREVCLLRSQMQTKGYTVVCRGDYNFTAFPSREGRTESYLTPERQASMSENEVYYVLLAGMVVLTILALFVVRSYGRYAESNRQKVIALIKGLEASQKAEAWSQALVAELQRNQRKTARPSPITGFPELPDDLRKEGGL